MSTAVLKMTGSAGSGGAGGFTGVMKLSVLEADGLEETSVRSVTHNKVNSIDPYLQVNVDDKKLLKTKEKKDTFSPKWDEIFSHNLVNAHVMSLTLFHSALLGEDPFVANSSIHFQDILDEKQQDLWIKLEPAGKLHIFVELTKSNGGEFHDTSVKHKANECGGFNGTKNLRNLLERVK